jgi:hypothetical protein
MNTMRKLLPLVAFGAGYVLGAKAGRERYEQIMRAANRVKDDPHVRSAASTVADTAREQAPMVKEKVAAAAHVAADKAPFGSSHNDAEPDSTVLRDNAHPEGKLP